MTFTLKLLESKQYNKWHKKLVKQTGSSFWDYPTLRICYPELAEELSNIAKENS